MTIQNAHLEVTEVTVNEYTKNIELYGAQR